jgi:adenosylhomocysteinase
MLVETNPDHIKARSFFRRILSLATHEGDARLVVIAHLVDSAIPFIPTIDERFHVQAILGKPSSIQPSARSYLSAAVPDREYQLDKIQFATKPEAIIEDAFPVLDRSLGVPTPVVLLDIGGYFVPDAQGLMRIRQTLEERGYELRGIIEDTENGHKRYEAILPQLPVDFGFSVFSVARSPLKRPENHLVGVAVTFSIEALLRQSNVVLQSRRAGVIGFGPIGRSVAHSLRNRGIAVSICEVDSIQLASAAAQGFRVYHYRHHFEDFARDLNLLVSATGAGADRPTESGEQLTGVRPLNASTVGLLHRGTFVASVTSADDEIDLAGIRDSGYEPSKLSYNDDVQKWVQNDASGRSPHNFYLMLGGNAVNFKHEGVIGPAIQLLQGEIAACINRILDGEGQSSSIVQELTNQERRGVADAWLDHYLVDSAASD